MKLKFKISNTFKTLVYPLENYDLMHDPRMKHEPARWPLKQHVGGVLGNAIYLPCKWKERKKVFHLNRSLSWSF